MDLNTLVCVVLLVLSLLAVILFLISNIIRPRGIHNAFNTEDDSRLNATGANIRSQDGISNSFITRDNTEANIQYTTIDTNRASDTNSSSGESSTNPIGTGNAEQYLWRFIWNNFNYWDVIFQLINRFGFGGGKEKKP